MPALMGTPVAWWDFINVHSEVVNNPEQRTILLKEFKTTLYLLLSISCFEYGYMSNFAY